MAGSPTTVCMLTPQGRGAVAVIAVQGPLAEAAVDQHFLPANNRPLAAQKLQRILFGRWQHAAGEEVVVCHRAVGSVEIHCHGGIAAPEAVCSSLLAAGCAQIDWQEACATHATDPIVAAARQALARAITERTAAILMDQLRGALSSTMAEAETLATSPRTKDRARARQLLAVLLERAAVGRHLVQPWKVVVAGPPNVGKSSLLNALAGYARAIVFDQPGTTRDLVTVQIALDGWPIELTDTAGLRTTSDPLEAAGVERAESKRTTADLVLLVFDRSLPWTPSDAALVASTGRALLIHNKADLPPHPTPRPPGLALSATTGQGLPELQTAIIQQLVPQPPSPGDAVPFEDSQQAQLHALLARLG